MITDKEKVSFSWREVKIALIILLLLVVGFTLIGFNGSAISRGFGHKSSYNFNKDSRIMQCGGTVSQMSQGAITGINGLNCRGE